MSNKVAAARRAFHIRDTVLATRRVCLVAGHHHREKSPGIGRACVGSTTNHSRRPPLYTNKYSNTTTRRCPEVSGKGGTSFDLLSRGSALFSTAEITAPRRDIGGGGRERGSTRWIPPPLCFSHHVTGSQPRIKGKSGRHPPPCTLLRV